MTIDLDYLDTLMERMQRLGIAELDVSNGGQRYHLVAGKAAVSVIEESAEPSIPCVADIVHSATDVSVQVMRSSMHGVFYRAPSPGEAPFVKEGDLVREGQALYVLEVMKTLSHIGAEFPCRIVTVDAQDAQIVVAGTPLFTVETIDA